MRMNYAFLIPKQNYASLKHSRQSDHIHRYNCQGNNFCNRHDLWTKMRFNLYAVIFTHANSMEANKVCTDITGVKLQTLLSTWFNTLDIEITSIDLQKLRSNHNHKHNAVIKIYLKNKVELSMVYAIHLVQSVC